MKTGITKGKPIICKRCGKVVGHVKMKWKWHVRMIAIATVIAFVVEFAANYIVQKILY